VVAGLRASLRNVGAPVGLAGRLPFRIFGRGSLARVAAYRVAMGAVLILVVSAISFVLVSLTPGNAAQALLGPQGTHQEYVALRRQLGLNLPLYEQYWRWLEHAITGNLGSSVISGASVGSQISSRLPVTLSLVIGSLLVSVIVGTAIGVISAVRRGLVDRGLDAISLVGFAVPSFWAGAVLIVIFAVDLKWLPATGYTPVSQSVGGWIESIVLPVGALSLAMVAAIAKQTRDAMIAVLDSEHIRAAWASGLSPRTIYLKHALKNAGMRIATITGVMAVGLLGGTVVVEVVFALPGLGSLLVNATATHDLPVVQGVVVVLTALVVVINLLVDLTYAALNPRVRTS
jgi:peptide/nickel transport system permease protein